MTKLRDISEKIMEKALKKAQKQIDEAYKKALGATEIAIGASSAILDGYEIARIEVSMHNNFHCRFKSEMPIEYLEKFRMLITEHYENEESYRHRSGIGLFIRYFEAFHKQLTPEYVLRMCEIDDNDKKKCDEGFREWLVGTRYSSDGNLKRHRPDWDAKLFMNETMREERNQRLIESIGHGSVSGAKAQLERGADTRAKTKGGVNAWDALSRANINENWKRDIEKLFQEYEAKLA